MGLACGHEHSQMETECRKERRGHAALRRGRVSVAQQAYHVTITTKHRVPMFACFEAGCAAARALDDPACRGDASMPAWMLMPDHLHVLLQLGGRDGLADVVSRLKATTARAVNVALSRDGAVWGRGFHDHAIRNQERLETVARYIIANPVRAGLVERVGDYPFWDAVYLSRKCPVPL